MADETPMIKQYLEIKRQYSDTILFFRLGDFYEMFFDDAKTAARELELTLTGKSCGGGERAPMCGVPFHSADTYIAKLVNKGYKVAICEQTEDPKTAKGLVKRDVIRVITKGSIIENNMLDEAKNNYLTAIYMEEKSAGICFTDVSTGTLNLTCFEGKKLENSIINELGVFSPSEIVLNRKCAENNRISAFINKRIEAACEMPGDEYFDYESCLNECIAHFGEQKLRELDLLETKAAVIAVGCTIKYLKYVQKNDIANITDINYYNENQFMKIDFSTKRNLEIVETMRNREKKGSLLWVLDKTKTAMGKRLLRSWLEKPLVNIAQISKRQNAVDELVNNNMKLTELSQALSYIYDIERLITRVVYESANAKELNSLKQTIEYLPQMKALLADSTSSYLKQLYSCIDELEDIYALIDSAIDPEAPFTLREGGLIKDGFNEELDSPRDIEHNGKKYLTDIENAEREKTGIPKLRIGYNRVFGYYIEVTNSYKSLVPETYIRKQTLANCERYITQELKDLESKVLGAQERSIKLEYELFCQVRKKVAGEYNRIQMTASAVATVDVLCSLAATATENNYVCPNMCDNSVTEIIEGRHPVVEKMLDGLPFVPNNTYLDCDENRCAIITGPNMAGKSTYMRQVALICLMAQIGSFVPAKRANLCIIDSIYTRVGASDDLASGQSTFMVEMSEVSNILKSAGKRSLIILDEVGRGTSTFDGMSIARAVLEYIADKRKIGAKTLFSTHYHELTELEGKVDGVKNYNISVKKRGDTITFLRRIVRGGADGSFGVEVAKLAGVPSAVVNRAKEILSELEKSAVNYIPPKENAFDADEEESRPMQISLQSTTADEIVDSLKNIDIDTLTPLEALTILSKLSNQARNEI
ncbi:MAG: DNA mismatch repair protein MutS [Acutalibacteraceae bacterium]